MIVYCTYCSVEKNTSERLLPAIERYKSKRISQVFDTAQKANFNFIILSGKYGILDSDQKIAHYDHLLTKPEVEKHSELVATQLKEKRVSKIIFYTGSIEEDKNIKLYIECIKSASVKSGIALVIKQSHFME